MKKILLSSFVAIAVFSFAIAQNSKKSKKEAQTTTTAAGTESKVDYQALGSPIPTLKIVDSFKVTHTEKEFLNDHNFFLFMFNPTCGHCINAAKMIVANHSEFKKIKIAFMAGPQMSPYLIAFYQSTDIGKYPEIKVGVDSAYAIEKIYNYQTLPQLNVYNNKNKLIKVFHGDLTIDSLRPYLN